MDNAGEESALKASIAQQQLLLQVQQIDTGLDQLEYRERSLPEHEQLVALDTTLAGLRDEAVRTATEVSDLKRDVTRAEQEVEQVRKRMVRDQELLESGSITVAKQLEELQHEVGTLARRQSELEDAELEVLEVLEQTEKRFASISERTQAAKSEWDEASVSRDAAQAEIAQSRASALQERTILLPDLPPEVLALYEKLRADNGGVGAAELRGGKCEGCRMQIPPTELARISAAEPDEVVRCDECRRILVRPIEKTT